MGSRTYIPTLVGIVKAMCIYITRHRETLSDNLSQQAQLDAMDALEVACQVFLSVVSITQGD